MGDARPDQRRDARSGSSKSAPIRARTTRAAKGDHNVAAAFRAWEGLNPESVLFSPARNDGVTTAVALPGGGLVSGQAAAIDLINGATGKAIIRKAPVAMVANLGSAQAADTTRARRAVHALPRSAGRCEGLRDEEAGLRARGDA